MITSYKELTVWQKAMDLVDEIYKLTKNLPKDEIFGLSSQIRRASVSIPSNIAEGYRRKSSKEKNQFYCIAFSSGAEVETQLEIIKRNYNYIGTTKAESLLNEVQKMLNTLTRLT